MPAPPRGVGHTGVEQSREQEVVEEQGLQAVLGHVGAVGPQAERLLEKDMTPHGQGAAWCLGLHIRGGRGSRASCVDNFWGGGLWEGDVKAHFTDFPSGAGPRTGPQGVGWEQPCIRRKKGGGGSGLTPPPSSRRADRTIVPSTSIRTDTDHGPLRRMRTTNTPAHSVDRYV